MPDTSPLTRKFTQIVQAVAAGADDTQTIFEAPFACTISDVSYTPDTTLTGANTDSRTVSLINKGATGVGTTAAATLAFVSGVNATAFDEKAITLSSTAADLVLAEGDIVAWKSLHVGATGLADPGGTVQVEVTRS